MSGMTMATATLSEATSRNCGNVTQTDDPSASSERTRRPSFWQGPHYLIVPLPFLPYCSITIAFVCSSRPQPERDGDKAATADSSRSRVDRRASSPHALCRLRLPLFPPPQIASAAPAPLLCSPDLKVRLTLQRERRHHLRRLRSTFWARAHPAGESQARGRDASSTLLPLQRQQRTALTILVRFGTGHQKETAHTTVDFHPLPTYPLPTTPSTTKPR